MLLKLETKNRPYIIAIAGPSGSGKTSVARGIAAALPSTIFSLDSYYFDLAHLSLEDRARANFDHPDSLDSDLLSQHLHQLAEGEEIIRPIYDFALHTRSKQTERVRSAEYLIVEGLFTLYWSSIRPIYGTKVFVEAIHDLCLPRRQARDVTERGRTPESVQKQYAETVRPMADQFVNPTKQFADIILDGSQPLDKSVDIILKHIRAHRPQ